MSFFSLINPVPAGGLVTGILGDTMENFFENEADNMDEIVNALFEAATSEADYADEVHSIPAFRLLQLKA